MEEGRRAGSVLRSWIGGRVELHYTVGSGGAAGGAGAYGTSAGQPEARTGEYVLRAVGEMGLEAQSPNPEEGRVIFVPWSSVFRIEGPAPENPARPEDTLELEDALRMEDPELIPSVGGQGDERQDERRELMDLLTSARTPSEAAEARAAADAWLSTRPGDGDVRTARERLDDRRYPDDADLEEGNPT